MDIKKRIDGMTEQEAKAALEWFVKQATVFICCEDCPFEDGCPSEATVKECERHFLDCVLKEARKRAMFMGMSEVVALFQAVA